jgi:HD superfamily phosphohydrolase
MAQRCELTRTIPEFSAYSTIKIAPDLPVPVTPRILKVIDSKTFQRLRKIRQLSLSDRVFPSATHTRFSHCLGVYKMVLDYLVHLDAFPQFYERYDESDYLAVMLAGLLHDLGHYPYSHQLDHIAPFPQHEDLTIGLLNGELQIDGENLKEIIESNFPVKTETIAALLGPQRDLDPKYWLLKQIIDSPVDADKCDYLPRDSYYCGVDYGSGFDRDRFIRNLVPSEDGLNLTIYEKGVMSAERFQLARYWMYRSVYWGHTVRALITMLGKACTYMRPVEIAGQAWLDFLLQFNDQDFLPWLREQVDEPGRELINMIEQTRPPYKRIYTVSFHQEEESYRRLQQKPIRDEISDWFVKWSAEKGLTLKEHHLLWDVPPIYKNESWESFPTKLKDGSEQPISQESPVIEALSKAFLHGVRKIRFYCHPDLAELIRQHPQEIPSLDDLLWPIQSDMRFV